MAERRLVGRASSHTTPGTLRLLRVLFCASARLADEAIICDPWNGSGTTTYTAALLSLRSQGFDLNPVMVVVARARLLPPSEADSIEPLANEIIKSVRYNCDPTDNDDPLTYWFGDRSAASNSCHREGG